MPQPDSKHLFLLLKRTVVMHIMWSYTWHPRGRCHCHTCSTAFSVKLFDGQRGIFDWTVEMLHGCPHHPGPLHCWNCLQHHSQILHHKCHYIYGRKICHWGLRLPLLDFLLCICLIAVWKSALYHCTVHEIVDIFLCGKILLACRKWHLSSREDLNSNKFSQVSPHLIIIGDTPVQQIMNFGDNSCVYCLVDTTSLGENKDTVTNDWYLYYVSKEKRMKEWSVCLPLR